MIFGRKGKAAGGFCRRAPDNRQRKLDENLPLSRLPELIDVKVQKWYTISGIRLTEFDLGDSASRIRRMMF